MKKNVFLKRTAVLVLALVLALTPALGDMRFNAATAIASFGDSGLYRWKWVFCDTYDKMKSTGIMNKTYSGTGYMKGDYSIVITNGNKEYYYAGMPTHGQKVWWDSGNVSESTWFDVSGKAFLTKNRNASNVAEYARTVTDGTAVAFRMFFEKGDAPAFSYSDFNGSKLLNSTNLYGFRNDGDTKWCVEKQQPGECFRFSFVDALSGQTASFAKSVVIHEDDNDKYIWAPGNEGRSISEVKQSATVDTIFKLWIGHYQTIPGIGKGSYRLPAGSTMTVDDEVSVIGPTASLEIERDAVMYVKGTLFVEGNIVNHGTIVVEEGGRVVVGGADTYGVIESDGNGANDGNFVVDYGGELEITPNTTLEENDMGFVFYMSGFSVIEGNFTCAGTLTFRKEKTPENGYLDFAGSVLRFARLSKIYVPYGSGPTSGAYNNIMEQYFGTSPVFVQTDNGTLYWDGQPVSK